MPRKDEDEVTEGLIEGLRSRCNDAGSVETEEDENKMAESFELPGVDLSEEEPTVHVIPRQENESTYSQCFLVHHASQLNHVGANGAPVCTEYVV